MWRDQGILWLETPLRFFWEGELRWRQVLGSGCTSAVPSIMILESQEGDLSFPFSLKSLLFGIQTFLHRQVNRTIIWNHRFLFLPLTLLFDVLIKLHRLYQVVTCESAGSVVWHPPPPSKVRQEHYFQWIISHISQKGGQDSGLIKTNRKVGIQHSLPVAKYPIQ